MKMSLKWMSDYLDISFKELCSQSKELIEELTNKGLEATLELDGPKSLKDIIVSEVKECSKHPEADKLSLCQVFDGKTTHQVVCGAPNVRKGLTIAFAPIGSVLPGDFQIKKAKIRGVESSGMICSETELGLPGDASGIWELDPSTFKVGTRLVDYLDLDIILDIELTADRSDALSYQGLSYDVARALGVKRTFKDKRKVPGLDFSSAFTQTHNGPKVAIEIEIEDENLCSQYYGLKLSGLKVSESPKWLQSYLSAHGVNCVNNVVDLTSFVMLEYGHPLHAFDAQKVKTIKIAKASSVKDKNFIGLNKKSYQINETDTVIHDGNKVLALAGVMGGESSSITMDTTEMILECALFHPVFVRDISRSYGISTESSSRFEKGVNPFHSQVVIARFVELLKEFCPDVKIHGLNAKGLDFEDRDIQPVEFDLRAANDFLDLKISLEQAQSHFISSGVEVEVDAGNKDILRLKGPAHRLDLREVHDYREELIRLTGIDEVPLKALSAFTPHKGSLEAVDQITNHLKLFLSHLGLNEAINYSFTSLKKLEQFRVDSPDPDATYFRTPALSVENPISKEMSVMRTSLIPSLFDNYVQEKKHQVDHVALFELAHTYESSSTDTGFQERKKLAIHLGGNTSPVVPWSESKVSVDFYEIKGLCEQVLEFLGLSKYRFEAEHNFEFLHPGKSASLIAFGKKVVGMIGAIHPRIAKSSKVSECYVLELDLSEIVKPQKVAKYTPVSDFPSVSRDLSLVFDQSVSFEKVEDIYQKWAKKKKEVQSFEMYDLFENEEMIKSGKKCFGLRIVFQGLESTLESEQVDQWREEFFNLLHKELGATYREG